jgi:large subunit ribosomal protein L19
MSLEATHQETTFGVGDSIKVYQKIKEADKQRTQIFEGIVIAIKNRGQNKTFTVRRVSQGVGIERIFPVYSPTIDKIEVTKKGLQGVNRAKLYYIREKPSREIEKIYSRAAKRKKEK